VSDVVTPIRKPFAPDDIPSTLRRIADEVEKDEHGLVTTCLVVMGHTEERPAADGEKLQSNRYKLYGCGPRCDSFTTRGLLLTVATRDLNGWPD
jgi:hypothetical protein